MAANLLLNCVKKLFPGRSRRDRRHLSRSVNRAGAPCRPKVEVLEDRVTPSNFNVVSLSDTAGSSTNVTLRYAVTNSVSGDTVSFDSSIVGGTITLGSTLTIAHNLTITGPGAGQMAISGNNAHEVFSISTGVTASISGLTVENGVAGNGGGIYNHGTLTLTNDAISNNGSLSNTTNNYGAGIYNTGNLTINGSTINNNSAYTNGGGIYNTGTVTMSNSTVFANAAFTTGGGIANHGTLILTNDTIAGNGGWGGNTGYPYGGGGGIYNGGSLTMNNTIVTGNTVADITGSYSGAYDLVGGVSGLATSLAYNGGPTQSLAVAPGSSAFSTGDPGQAGTISQNGVTRQTILNVGAYQTPYPTITSSTANLPSNATIIAISGSAFDPIAANNIVTFDNGVTGTVTSGTSTTLVVSLSGLDSVPVGTALNATVTDAADGLTSGALAQVATVGAAQFPSVTLSTANMADTSTTIIINGSNFDPVAAGNTVAFSSGVAGTVTSATATQLTVTITAAPTSLGSLTAVVSSYGIPNSAPVQVATVVNGNWLVTNGAGAGGSQSDVTLPYAVTNALSGDTIGFAASLTGGTISLANTLAVHSNVTISGQGAPGLKISGYAQGLVGTYFNLPAATNLIQPANASNSAWLGNQFPAATMPLLGPIDFRNIAYGGGFVDTQGNSYYTYGGSQNNVEARWYGDILIPGTGSAPIPISFGLGSDDGSILYVDGNLVVNNNTFQGNGTWPAVQQHATVNLTPGLHAIDVEYYQGGGGASVWAEWDPTGGANFVDIPNSAFANPAQQVQVFTIASGVSASISNLTIENGLAASGGGVSNAGTLTLSGDTFTNNTATGAGGGIANSGTLTLVNSTVANNIGATGSGGGIYNSGTLYLSNDTVAYNSGGGLSNIGGGTFQNTIITANTNGSDVVDINPTTTYANNVIGGASVIAATLASNGGSTQTILPAAGSPAIGNGGALTSLSSNVGLSDTTISVQDAAVIAQNAGTYYITVGTEEMLVTNVDTTTNTLTVQRGFNGTTAASHATGIDVSLAADQRGHAAPTPQDIGAVQSFTPTVTANTATMPGYAATIIIDGTNFSPIAADDAVIFNSGATGIVTAATTTQLTVTFTSQPLSAGSLTAVVVSDGHTSGSPVQVATVTGPSVTANTATLPDNSTTITITGTNFDPDHTGDSVVFNLGVTGIVTAATATQLTVTLTAPPTALGNLTAVVYSGAGSGAPVQVGTEVNATWVVTDAYGSAGSLTDLTLPFAAASALSGDTITFAASLSGHTVFSGSTMTLHNNVTITGQGVPNVTISSQLPLPNIPGLQYQLDASNAGSLTTSGNNVTQWNDLSGNSYNFTPAISGQDPVLVPNAIGGLPALRFSPTSPAVGTPLVGAAHVNAQTVIMVNFIAGTSAQGCCDGIWGMYGTDQSIRVNDGSGGTAFYGRPDDGGNSGDYTTIGAGGSTWISEASSFDHNTTSVGPLGTANILVATGNITPNNLTQIGGGSYQSRYFVGDVGEVLVYDTQLTDAQRQEVEAYLSNKWLGTSLPGAPQVFNIAPGANVTITDLTIANGTGTSGGGVNNQGTLTLAGDTIARNSAVNGAGVYNSGTLTVVDSTIASNSASASGGGIYNSATGTLHLSNATIANNTAAAAGGVATLGTATIQNTIVAQNTGGDLTGTYTGGNDVIGGSSVVSATLASNGGPTQTLAFVPGSPAVGNGGALTSVTSSVGVSDTTIHVQDAAAIAETPGSYDITIDSEEMLVTNVNTAANTLTVQRGFNSTTAAAHTTGASIALATDQRGDPTPTPQDVGAYQSFTPTVTANSANLADSATTIIIVGTHFSTTAANNVVTFNLGLAGTVTAATTTQLTVTLTSPPTSLGVLTAVVSSSGHSSGAPVQVGTEVNGTWVVTDATGVGGSLSDVTLPFAVASALSGDTITFASSLSGRTIVTGSTLTLNNNVTITGQNAPGLTISALATLPNIPGLQYQLDASNTNSVITDGSGNVQQWNDLSGNNYNFTPAIPGQDPVLVPNAFGSLPALQFSPAGPSVGTPMVGAANVNAQTVIMVNFISGTSAQGCCDGIWGMYQTDQSIRVDDGSGGIKFQGSPDDGGNGGDYTTIGTGGSTWISEAGSFDHHTTSVGPLGTPNILVATGNITPVNLTEIGGGSYQNRDFVGDVGEALVYNTQLTASQRQAVETYLTNKWLLGIGNTPHQVFNIASGAHVTISDLTITNGASTSGGGVSNAGALTLSSDTLTGNSATNGGAVFNSGALTVVNSTIANNTASVSGGGIFNAATGTLNLSNATIAYNTATTAGSGLATLGAATIQNTIVTANTGGDVSGAYTDGGNNLVTDSPGIIAATLANNGGPTQTLDLLAGSPAIAAGGALTSVAAASPVGVSDTTIHVQNAGSIAQTPGGYYVLIGSEEMLVTNVNTTTNTLTVQRGVNGTTAATHAAGTGVYLALDQRGDYRLAPPPSIGAVEPQDSPWIVTDPNGTLGSGGPFDVTLPFAVNAVNNGVGLPVIEFADGVNSPINLTGDTIVLNSTLNLTSNVTITGLGAANLTISGNNAVQVFNVASGVTATISGVTIAHGSAVNGGGVSNAGTLTLSGDALSSNAATGNGGGVYNTGTLTVNDFASSGNTASSGSGIYNSLTGTLTVSSDGTSPTSISDNIDSKPTSGVSLTGTGTTTISGNVGLGLGNLTDSSTGQDTISGVISQGAPLPAYVGFTGATGGLNSTQSVLNWTYSSGATNIDYSGGFATNNLSLNGGASVVGTGLQLTNDNNSEARSAWTPTPVSVANFTSTFEWTYAGTVGQPADGFTFAIQGSSATALGAAGSGLGYQGIPGNSLAVQFNEYSGSGSNSGSDFGVGFNGVINHSINLVPSGVDFSANPNDVFKAVVTESGSTLTVSIWDTTTNGTDTPNYTQSFPVVGIVNNVIKNGTGTLTLANANLYNGTTTVSAGVLNLGNDAATSTGTVNVLTPGTLNFAAGITSPVLGALAGTGDIALTTATSQAVTLNAGSNGSNSSYSGVLSGLGGLTKQGDGTLELFTPNTYAGATLISAGSIQFPPPPGTLPSIPGLQYVLDASNAGSLVTGGEDANGLGLDVTQWNDLSGNNYNFSTAIPGQNPVLVPNAFGALPGLQFYNDFAGTPMAGANGVNAQTVIMVDFISGVSDCCDGIWGAYGSDQSIRVDVGSGGMRFQGSPDDGGNNGDYTTIGTGGSTWISESGSFDQNTTYVGSLGTANILAATGNLTPATTQIGGGSYGTRYFQGDIGEVLVYNTQLTPAQRQAVETYLSDKWLGTSLATPIPPNILPTTTNLTIAAGATLDLQGDTQQVAGVTGSGAVIDSTGTNTSVLTVTGTAAPGTAGPGVLTTGNVVLPATSTFAVDLTGTAPGTQYDQLEVNGTATLGGALSVNLGSYTPQLGDTFDVIQTTGGVVGTFSQGSTYTSGGYTYAIDYAGGTGGDVVLTVTGVPGTTTTSITLTDNGPNPSTSGQAVSFTVTVTGGTPINGQTVTIEDADAANAPVGTGTLSDSTVTFNISNLTVGTHHLFAVYGGDATHSGSNSSATPIVQNVIGGGAAPAVVSVVVNGGAPQYTDGNGVQVSLAGQNSIVEQLLVTFNEAVTLDAGAFTISTNLANFQSLGGIELPNTDPVGLNAPIPVTGSGGTQFILTFLAGSGVNSIPGPGIGTYIKDGVYNLNTIGSHVHANSQTAVDNHAGFWALFGSVAADNLISGSIGDGNSDILVDTPDAAQFKIAFGTENDSSLLPDQAYDAAMDSNLSGVIGTEDAAKFKHNFGTEWMF